MNTKPQTNTLNIAATLNQLDKNELLTLVKQMIELYPDLAHLVDILDTHEETRHAVSIDPEHYRLKVTDIFYNTDCDSWGAEARAAEPLLDIAEIGDAFLAQQRYANAATIYEIIIRAILDNYDSFNWHADEGDLDDVVVQCTETLDTCLQKEQQNTAVRTQIIQTLQDVYEFNMNLHHGEPVLSKKIPLILVQRTTPAERKTLAAWLRTTFQPDIDWENDDLSPYYDQTTLFLLGLEGDTLDDATFLRACRATKSFSYLIERLLTREHNQEALAEAQQVDTYYLLEIANIFCEHGLEADAEQLVMERSKSTQNANLLEWLQKRYQDRGDNEGALSLACRLFRTPSGDTIERYREIRQLAELSSQWENVQPELLASVKQSRNIALQIEIALEEGQPQEALTLLQSQQKQKSEKHGPYGNGLFNIGIEVAKAVEATEPLEAITIYQNYVEIRIAGRGREQYQVACQHLIAIRRLFQKLDKSNQWTTYLTDLRTQNNRLPALKDEMAKAGL
jgi:hypothetical protein